MRHKSFATLRHLTQVDFPSISRWQRKIAALSFVVAYPNSVCDFPVITISNKCSVIVHACLTSYASVSPFPNKLRCSIISPLAALFGQVRAVILHSNKRVARVGQCISLAAKILNYDFTSAVSDSGHVERTSMLFTAVESQLSERQVCPQLIHGVCCDAHSVVLIVADPTVWCLSGPYRGVSRIFDHEVGNKKPAT